MDKHWCTVLAERIADRLFTNGIGEKADRLVLELPGKRDGGGWCKEAVRDQIEQMFLEAMGIKAAKKQKAKPARPASPRPARRTGRSG